MPITLESARSIFPNTLAADLVPATIARFNQLSAEDQLALIWYAYLEMGKTITIAAPGAARMQFAELTLNQIRAMSFSEQTKVITCVFFNDKLFLGQLQYQLFVFRYISIGIKDFFDLIFKHLQCS